ncbi:hypothetical protein Ancab_016753 [Ancistrocladus abbreviatus]
MAHAVRVAARPLWHPPRQSQCLEPFLHRLLSPHAIKTTVFHRTSFITIPSSHRGLHFRARGLRFPNTPAGSDSDLQDSQSESKSETNKSRNEKKREARRAVRWGMELASFSTPQIKRILRVASLEQEVFEALMLVKRLGPDVREGKRRQFNYIGKLLRDAKPDLLGALIQATKDGDQSRLQALSGSGEWFDDGDDVNDDKKVYQYESEDVEEESHGFIALANKWYDGLLNKDIEITNEVYSGHGVEFDRQELRKLVRRVHSLQDHEDITEVNGGAENSQLISAKRSLTRFLRSLAKQIPTKENVMV